MTLILSCITQDYVVQVSDRRLTKNGQLEDNETNKVVVWNGMQIFGYTGVAELGPSKQTDQWMTEVLSPVPNFAAALDALRESTDKEFKRKNYSKRIRFHAYVGVGWGAFKAKPSEWRACVSVVSNYTNCRGDILSVPLDKLATDFYVLPEDLDFYMVAAGQSLSQDETTHFLRIMRKAIKKGSKTSIIVGIMSDLVRHVSERNSMVGDSLMVAVLPKSAVPIQHIVLPGNPLNSDGAVFAYLPSPTLPTSVIYFAPNFASREMSIIGTIMEKGAP